MPSKKVLADDINDVAKDCIASRLIKALNDESLTKIEASKLLGFNSNVYPSFVVNKKLWDKCPASVWNTLQKWCNSGLSIKKFSILVHGTFQDANTVKQDDVPAGFGKVEVEAEHLKEKKEPVKETLATRREVLNDLFAIFGNGNFMKLDPMTLEEAIEECKKPESPMYFNNHNGCTILRAKKLYNIVTKPVETLFE